jgi:ElaB/YqjD/DUF883 family membrane-anchored ribosome-binding protein
MDSRQIEQGIDEVRDDLAQLDHQVRSVLRERPFVALGTMMAAGFFLGRVLGRR